MERRFRATENLEASHAESNWNVSFHKIDAERPGRGILCYTSTMCFSVEVEKELRKTALRFKAQVSLLELNNFEKLRAQGEDFEWSKRALNLSRRPTSNIFRVPDNDGRIYPGYFTSVLVQEQGVRMLKPMRYRIRPRGSREEIPSKFNVFNARLDSLEHRQTWRPLFQRQHGLVPFTRFFEWVEHEGSKRLISFRPANRELMWAPCLWDYWANEKEGAGFYSFAIITDDPPAEVLAQGHDRCPVFLREDLIDEWLSPVSKSLHDLYAILKNKQDAFYLSDWAS